ncbi:MAG: glycoside hydrolase family 24 protein [Nostochopsis sp.]
MLKLFKFNYPQGIIPRLNRWVIWFGFALLGFSLIILPISPSQGEAITGANVATTELNLNIKAFLDTIAWAEGTSGKNGYQMIFGGNSFSNFQKHPRQRKCLRYKGKKLCSDAAGRYQFLSSTWVGLVQRLKLSDFSPRSQDSAAVELIREQGALTDVESGLWQSAIYKVADIWASLPCGSNKGSCYGQPYKRINKLGEIYTLNLKKYQERDSSPDIPLPSCETALFGDCV